jgi:anti-sigma B factor antagonist
MELTVAEAGAGVTCIRLEGRLDAAGADLIGVRFTAAIVPAGHDAIVDLSGVTFLASMGMRLLISTARALGAKPARLVLFGAQPLVQDVLEQAALDQIMPITANEAQALSALAG